MGRAIARQFAAEGAIVVALDLNLEAAQQTLQGCGEQHLARALNVADAAAVNALVDEVLALRGRVDVLVNNAGTGGMDSFTEMSDEAWARVIVKREFQVSDTAMGLLSGLTFALFYSTLAIPFGRYADRANRRNFVAYCCAAWSAMTALCGMAGGYWSLALARVGVAVGEAGGTSPSMSMIADHYPPQLRGRAMGVYWIGPQLGILFGLTLGGWIAHHYGWRAAFLWMGLPGIAVALLLRYTGVEPQRGRWEATAAAGSAQEPLRLLLRDLWASKTFVRITLAGLMMGFAGYGIGIWTPAFLVRSHGMTLQGAGAIMGLLGGAMAALVGYGFEWLHLSHGLLLGTLLISVLIG